MKKYLLFALLLAASTTGFSQTFDFGVKAGMNISNFTGGNVDNVKASTLIGYHAGAFIGLYVGHNFSIDPEVMFSTQGAKIDDHNTGKVDYKLTYINVPVLVKYRFNGGFYLEAGPQVGFNIHEDVNGNSADFAKNTLLCATGGLGFHSKMGLGIGARYSVGLSKVGDYDISNTHPDWKNNFIQFSIFYTFFNGQKK